MPEHSGLGPWIRRFLLEHMVAERNLSLNTQRSYRDTLCLLLPFACRHCQKQVDRLTIDDLSAPGMPKVTLSLGSSEAATCVMTETDEDPL